VEENHDNQEQVAHEIQAEGLVEIGGQVEIESDDDQIVATGDSGFLEASGLCSYLSTLHPIRLLSELETRQIFLPCIQPNDCQCSDRGDGNV